MDVHKHETELYFLPESGGKPARSRVKTQKQSLLRAIEGKDGPVILEAVGFHRPVVGWLQAAGRDVRLANPRQIPKPRVKTDKKDARHLARLYRGELLPESWVPPKEIQLLRDLTRHKSFLADQAGALKSKIMHDLQKHGHFYDKNPADTIKGRARLNKLDIPEITSSLAILEVLETQAKTYQKRIEEEAEKNTNAQLLMTIPGIGAYTALGIVAEVGDFSRFSHPEKLASYAGMSIGEHQSGDTQRRGHITKEGNLELLTLLVEAAQNHIRYCPDSMISKKYERKHATSPHKVALVAAARALLHACYAMIRDQQPFQVNPKPQREPAA